MAGVSVSKASGSCREDAGAAIGASVFRLVPSFRLHNGKQTSHPVLRPPPARMKSREQFEAVCDLMQVWDVNSMN